MKLLTGTLILLALSHCGKDDNSPKGPLSAGQKLQVQEVMRSIADVQGAGLEISQRVTGKAPTSLLQNLKRLGNLGKGSDTKNSLAEALKTSECIVSEVSPTNATSDSYRVLIAGDKCPITLSLSSEVTGDGKEVSKVTYQMDYIIRDPAFNVHSDLTSGHITGDFSTKNQDEISLAYKGSLRSQKHGDIELSMTASVKLKANEGNLEFKMAFKDFSASVRAVGDGQSMKYYVQDEEVTEEEARLYLEAILKTSGADSL